MTSVLQTTTSTAYGNATNTLGINFTSSDRNRTRVARIPERTTATYGSGWNITQVVIINIGYTMIVGIDFTTIDGDMSLTTKIYPTDTATNGSTC